MQSEDETDYINANYIDVSTTMLIYAVVLFMYCKLFALKLFNYQQRIWYNIMKNKLKINSPVQQVFCTIVLTVIVSFLLYIIAILHMQGYKRKNAYIATQGRVLSVKMCKS